MPIRCAAKALIFRDGKILLNRCRHEDGSIYYDLPGGGQHQYESMHDAVVREVLEETGYCVRILRPAAFSEEIYTDSSLRAAYPDYAHRICHIFLAEIDGNSIQLPTEMDHFMEKSEWITLNDAAMMTNLCPPGLSEALPEITNTDHILFLGTHYNDTPEA